MPRAAGKKTEPVSTGQFLETEEQTVGQDRPRTMKSTGPAKKSLEPATIEVVDKPLDTEKADMLRFMEEELIVVVHQTTDPAEAPMPQIINDGRSQFFIRGEEQKVKRKFVEVLARAKRTTYTQVKTKDAEGNEFYKNIPHTALRYPFAVIQDPNPRGRDWLKAILAEG